MIRFVKKADPQPLAKDVEKNRVEPVREPKVEKNKNSDLGATRQVDDDERPV
jgi:hypothetical protein